MIKISLDTISEEQVWQKPNDSLNTIGNLILHLCGNMTQYGIASLNETVDERQRDVEFSTKGGFTKKELLKKLETTVNEVKKTLQNTSAERLVSLKKVQGFEFSGIGNSIHLVEHFSYHTGQIAFWVKLLNNKPLGFYDGLDLTVLNDD
jgi:uncharacterized damage-inducible protein DinB